MIRLRPKAILLDFPRGGIGSHSQLFHLEEGFCKMRYVAERWDSETNRLTDYLVPLSRVDRELIISALKVATIRHELELNGEKETEAK